jgi:SAM-dependent methyltransferase
MIRFTDKGQTGTPPPSFSYVDKVGPIPRLILPVTRYLRAYYAGKYLSPAPCHLDIGCGDGYFLKRSPCTERIGIDPLMGDQVSSPLDFSDGYFDYVTMLAVIEHITNPVILLEECARILKPGGRLILTTPKRSAETLIKLYYQHVEDEHETYFDLGNIQKVSEPWFTVTAHGTFIFGLNQVFCLEKK